jgi:hypothetical protein
VIGTRVSLQAADQKLADGFAKHEGTIGALLIDGKKIMPADVIQTAQARIATSKAAQASHAAWQTAVKADRDERAGTRVFMTHVRQALMVMFASSIDTLADFGLAPRKRRAPKPVVKVQAAALAKATRQARGTKGKTQKAKIKGAAPQPAPATSPAVAGSATASPSPAPVAPAR